MSRNTHWGISALSRY